MKLYLYQALTRFFSSPLSHLRGIKPYQQGASEPRIARVYLALWLGWAGCFLPSVATIASPVMDAGGDTGNTFGYLLSCDVSLNCGTGIVHYAWHTTDFDTLLATFPFVALLPDNNPSGQTNPARFYSYISINDFSLPPTVSCSGATIQYNVYSTSVTLSDGANCPITVTPQASGDPSSNVVYTGVLSRTGNIYYLKQGNIVGSTVPVNAPIDLKMSNQVESYSTEIEVK